MPLLASWVCSIAMSDEEETDTIRSMFKALGDHKAAVLPVIPQWNIRVGGRMFAHYTAIARKK